MKKNNTKNETDKKNVNEKQPKYIKQIVKQNKTQFGEENNNKKTEDQGTKKNRGPHNKGRDDGDELTKASRDYIEDQGPKKILYFESSTPWHYKTTTFDLISN